MGVRGAPESPAARNFGGGACSPAGGWNAIRRWRGPESGAEDSRSFRSPKRRCCGPGPGLGGTEVASLRRRRGSVWRSRGVWAELGFGRRCGAIDDAGRSARRFIGASAGISASAPGFGRPEIAAGFGAARGEWIEHRSPLNPAGAGFLEGGGLWEAGQWASGARTGKSGAMASEGARRARNRGARRGEGDESVLWDRAASERGELWGWALACGLGPRQVSRGRGRPVRGGGERAGPWAIGRV